MDRQTDRQTDMPKRRVAFRNFANTTKTLLVTMRKAKENQSGLTPKEYQMLERWDLVQTRICAKFIYPVPVTVAVFGRITASTQIYSS